MNKSQYNLNFCFKGNRKYVQGPDIFDSVCDLYNKHYTFLNLDKVRCSSHSLLTNNAIVIFTNSPEVVNTHLIKSEFHFVQKNSEVIYAFVIDHENKIECTKEYSEDYIQNESEITENEITFYNANLKSSLSEILVSMNKYFFQNTTTDEGKWIFTKIEIQPVEILLQPVVGKTYKLKLIRNFQNKLTKSAIFVEGIKVGHLYFSLVQ